MTQHQKCDKVLACVHAQVLCILRVFMFMSLHLLLMWFVSCLSSVLLSFFMLYLYRFRSQISVAKHAELPTAPVLNCTATGDFNTGLQTGSDELRLTSGRSWRSVLGVGTRLAHPMILSVHRASGISAVPPRSGSWAPVCVSPQARSRFARESVAALSGCCTVGVCAAGGTSTCCCTICDCGISTAFFHDVGL